MRYGDLRIIAVVVVVRGKKVENLGRRGLYIFVRAQTRRLGSGRGF